MPKQQLTIIPVTLHSENKNIPSANSTVISSDPSCTIKMANTEITFFNGIDERIIQTVMRELNINET